MKQKVSKIKRVTLTALAVVCAFSSVAAISANAASTTINFTSKNSSKVSCILSSSEPTSLVISPLQCRAKKGSEYKNVTDTNSTGRGTSIYASVVPGSGWILVASEEFDYVRYATGSNPYSIHRYWR